MSRPKKNQETKEPAVKAGSETNDRPKKPFENMMAEIEKHDPLGQICSDIQDTDFEGTIEFTEEDLNALTPDAEGRNIFEFYQLDEPEEEFEDWIHMELPIMNNELAKKNEVYVMLIVPYLQKMSLEELMADPRFTEDSDVPCIVLGDLVLIVTQQTLEEYSKVMSYIGFEGGITQIEDNEEMMDALIKLVESAQVRENGYCEDLMEYWYAGNLFHEKDVIWVELEKMGRDKDEKNDDGEVEENQVVGRRVIGDPPTFVLNFDVLGGFHRAVDISRVKDVKVDDKSHRRILSKREIGEAKMYNRNLEFLETLTPNEEVWYLAAKKAEEEDSAGFAVVCLNGRFCVPVETSINFYTHEVEEYISLFNVTSCFTNHHNCIGWIIIDVGNMQVCTGVRYLKGKHMDWQKRIEQELKSYRLGDPDFDPYTDPYDPKNFYGDDF